MTKYEAKLRWAEFRAEAKLWLLITGIILFPLALILWALWEYRSQF